jgi:Type II secretion system (T2SS), protein E, N-terminal domain
MSATDFALVSTNTDDSAESRSRVRRWWLRLSSRCAGSVCPKRGKLWPYWLDRSDGVDFEGRWYCGRVCLESVLAGRVHALLSTSLVEKPRSHRLPLGLLLVDRGVISAAQLREALRLQREAGHGRVGDWLRQTADLSVQQLTAALGQQWGCPVFPLEQQAAPIAWSDRIPLPLLESAAAVPAYASSDGRILHLAFCDRVDHALLYAVEQMLLCHTFPCVAPATAIQTQLEKFALLTSGNDTSFDTVRESPEMTWTICNYAAELNARRLVLARAASYIWVRFFRAGPARDLLFRIVPANHANCLPGRTKALAASADGARGGVSDASLPL